MSTSPSIPYPPTPGKDPPSHTHSGGPTPSTNIETEPPQINEPIPPTPSSSITSPSQNTQSKTIRPSPLRQTTSSSILPSQSQPQPDDAEHEPPAQRPPFTPFFTLIHDPATNTTHHPSRIHYLFSDDEDNTDLLTSACIRSLDPASPLSASQDNHPKSQASETTSSSSSSATFRNPKPNRVQKREERVIVVDVNASGDSIIRSSSLSSSWQVLNAAVSNAPTWDGAEQAPEEERGLMLRIEGVGSAGPPEEEGLGIIGKSALLGEEEMQALMEGFDRKMAILRKVVSAGEVLVLEKGETVEKGEEGKVEGKEA